MGLKKTFNVRLIKKILGFNPTLNRVFNDKRSYGRSLKFYSHDIQQQLHIKSDMLLNLPFVHNLTGHAGMKRIGIVDYNGPIKTYDKYVKYMIKEYPEIGMYLLGES